LPKGDNDAIFRLAEAKKNSGSSSNRFKKLSMSLTAIHAGFTCFVVAQATRGLI